MHYAAAVITALVGLVYSAVSLADDEVIDHLLDTPVTLMDFGLDSVGKVFSLEIGGGSKLIVSPIFREKKNRFELKIDNLGKLPGNVDVARKWCQKAISGVRRQLGVDPQTGQPFVGESSIFGAYFESAGANERPDKLRRKLDNMVTIIALSSLGDGKDNFVKCEGSLLDSKISVEPPHQHGQ